VELGRLRLAAERPGAPQIISSDELAARNQTLFAQMRALAATGGAKQVDDYTTTPGAQTQLQTNSHEAQARAPCPQQAPFIVEVKGAVAPPAGGLPVIQPGGGVGVTGKCFGAQQGEIHIYGEFPNGYLTLQQVVWSDGLAAGTVPDITGVIGQVVRVEVVRADGRASPRQEADFNPHWQETVLTVPASLIHLDSCGDPAPDCFRDGATQGVHQTGDGKDSDADTTGVDTWDVRLAKGWHLTTLSMWNDLSSQPITITGFDKGPPEQATFSFHFAMTCGAWQHAPFVGDTCVQSLAKYSFEIHAVGPVGVLPTPGD
jgi:hypothetical protein